MTNAALAFKMFKCKLQGKNPLFETFMRDKKVLDVGCGEGHLLRKDTDNIWGIDINKTLVEKLQKDGLKVVSGDVASMPFDDDYFDVVACCNVIEHLGPVDAHRMLKEIKRVLKPHGIVILTTPMPKAVWNTFGHIKPYPPMAIRKLFREVSRESFDSITDMRIRNIIYFGGGSKIVTLYKTVIAQALPSFRYSYLMIIEKKEKITAV